MEDNKIKEIVKERYSGTDKRGSSCYPNLPLMEIVKDLKDLKELLDDTDIKYWVDAGTLIGAVRNGKIIPWDDDVDFGFWGRDWDKVISIAPKLEELGFKVHLTHLELSDGVVPAGACFVRCGFPIYLTGYTLSDENAIAVEGRPKTKLALILKALCLLCNGRRILAIMPSKAFSEKKSLTRCLKTIGKLLMKTPTEFRRIVKRMLLNLWLISGSEIRYMVIPKHFFQKLKKIRFYDMYFLAPSDTEGYLEYRYGENWRVPIRDWEPEESPALIIPGRE